jgi:hypothetical protein
MTRAWIAVGLAWAVILSAAPADARLVEGVGSGCGRAVVAVAAPTARPAADALTDARPGIDRARLTAEQFAFAFGPEARTMPVGAGGVLRPASEEAGSAEPAATLPVAGLSTPTGAAGPVPAHDATVTEQASRSLFGAPALLPAPGGPSVGLPLLAAALLAGTGYAAHCLRARRPG